MTQKPKVPKRKSSCVRGRATNTFPVTHIAGFLAAITLNIAITSQLRFANAIENAFNNELAEEGAEVGGSHAHFHLHEYASTHVRVGQCIRAPLSVWV